MYFRLNSSFLSAEGISDYIRKVRKSLEGAVPTFIVDLKGKKVRIGQLQQPIALNEKDTIQFILSNRSEKSVIPILTPGILKTINKGDTVLLQDASVQLQVIDTFENGLVAKTIIPGVIRSGAGIALDKQYLLEDDYLQKAGSFLEVARESGVEYLALSYTTEPDDLLKLSSYCRRKSYTPKIVAKIEHPLAFRKIKEICESADEVWYCRGDLGTFVNMRQLSIWQDALIQICQELHTPLVIAGQVFQHLTYHRHLTRSEAVHFYHLIDRGVAGIVLSDETTLSKNPANSLESVASLLRETDLEKI
jgi:pyruvate kinase